MPVEQTQSTNRRDNFSKLLKLMTITLSILIVLCTLIGLEIFNECNSVLDNVENSWVIKIQFNILRKPTKWIVKLDALRTSVRYQTTKESRLRVAVGRMACLDGKASWSDCLGDYWCWEVWFLQDIWEGLWWVALWLVSVKCLLLFHYQSFVFPLFVPILILCFPSVIPYLPVSAIFSLTSVFFFLLLPAQRF